MEKKFTRAMVHEEFKSKCRECPLHCCNNFKSLPCSVLTDDDIDFIMKDYPYADVKVRMIFNDIETRLAAVEKKVSNNVSVEFKPERIVFGCSYNRNFNDFSVDVVDKKRYNKLEAKHEADCRLISEYDMENKELKKANSMLDRINKFYVEDVQRAFKKQRKAEETADILKAERKAMSEYIDELKSDVEKAKDWEKRYKELEYLYEKKDAENNKLEDKYERQGAVLKKKYDEIDTLNKQIDSFGLTCRLYEKETKDLRSDVERWVERYKRIKEMEKKRLFDLKNVENERDHYKGLYSTKCDDYDRLLEKQLKTEKEAGLNYRELFHSLNHKHQNVVGEMKNWKERAIEAEQKLKETEEKYNDTCVLNKMREDVFEANIKLQKTIEAKDREIGLLRAELDKYKTDDECDDRWID